MTTSSLVPTGASVSALRHDWQRSEVESIYRTPLPSLVFRAQTVHRQHHPQDRVQTCQLLSIKTGGWAAGRGYFPQSGHLEGRGGGRGLVRPPAGGGSAE